MVFVMTFDFTGKTVVLSGAASGMGLLFAQKFVEMGGNAVMSDINPDTLNEAVASVNSIRADSAIGVVCDVRVYEQVQAVCAAAIEKFGSIDVVIPFAGGAELRMLRDRLVELGAGNEFPDIPIEIYDWSLDVNLRSQLYFDHAAMKYMREQKSGVIIHVGSITGEEGGNVNVGYATAKSGAMNGLTKSIAQIGASYNVRCNCIAPGPVLTRPGMASMKTLAGRAAEPIEIINATLYLASDESAFVNGITLLIDGGRNVMFNKS
jgi:3-oxoacyl-[acyl-carrier protein] reductase